MSAPRVKDQLHAITERGGRVVVVDPRRSETARAFEHVAVHPDGDAWLLLSLLQVIFAEGLEDAEAIARQSRGVEALRELRAAPAGGDRGAHRGRAPTRSARSPATSPPPSAPRSTAAPALASGATAPSSRSCSTRSTSSPATSTARAAACSATRRSTSSDVARMLGLATYDKRALADRRTSPRCSGSLPATVMAKEITTPGKGQIRALFVSAGNPVLSVPNGARARGGDGRSSSCCVAIDLYVSDTARHADYVLPATTIYEREDFPLPFLACSRRRSSR